VLWSADIADARMKITSVIWLGLGVLWMERMLMASNGLKETQPEKQFLYRIQPTRTDLLKSGPTKEEATLVEEHFNYLQDLTAKGVAILVGRTLTTEESTFGLVIFRAESEEAAREIMNNDPAVKNGVMRAALFPFRVVLMEGKSG
jgi:uncharacterized protein YciI